MNRWGKDWSVYRTVKEVPVTIDTSTIKRLKKGNGWDQFIKHTPPDKATLKRNLNAVRSSNVDPEGDEYDAFDAEHTHQEAIVKVALATEIAEEARLAAAGGPEATRVQRQTATLELIDEEDKAKKLAAQAAKIAAKTGRPKYPDELNILLAQKKAEGKKAGKSARVIKEEGVAFARQYTAAANAAKEEARKATIAAAKAKKGGAAPPAAAVGGGGSAAAAAAADAASDSDEELSEEEKKAKAKFEEQVEKEELAKYLNKEYKRKELEKIAIDLGIATNKKDLAKKITEHPKAGIDAIIDMIVESGKYKKFEEE
jgi:hypothetical protein